MNSTPLKQGGTDFFRNIPPFPEWNIKLGPPQGLAIRKGEVWMRRFKHLDVVLNISNGTAELIPLENGEHLKTLTTEDIPSDNE